MTELKELMIHVEGIVRPIRATEGRKLRMRRELLAHLQAALEEERERNAGEAEAWAAAKRRLGPPEELTSSLQKSVPLPEHALMGHVPVGGWFLRWERKLGRSMGMGHMSMMQQSMFTLGAMILTYGAIILLALRTRAMYRDAMMRLLAEPTWQYQAGTMVNGLLLIFLMGSCFALLGAAAHWQRRAMTKQIGWMAFWILVWQVNMISFIAGQRLLWQDFAWSAITLALLAGSLLALGRIIAWAGRPYREWLALEIAG